jgi:hypothetical protein
VRAAMSALRHPRSAAAPARRPSVVREPHSSIDETFSTHTTHMNALHTRSMVSTN